VGYRVLPPSALPYDGYRPPTGMDGFPAPLSILYSPHDAAASEAVWTRALHLDFDLANLDAISWAADAMWYGPAGIGTARSRHAYATHFLRPLHGAFSRLRRTTEMVVCEGSFCGAYFTLHGDHTGPWLGEQPTGRRVPLRCGAHARIVDGMIVEGWLIVDIPLAFDAMGVDLYGRAAAVTATVAPS
jgi:hypothetical protein